MMSFCLHSKLRLTPTLTNAFFREEEARKLCVLDEAEPFVDLEAEAEAAVTAPMISLLKLSVVKTGAPPSATSTETYERGSSRKALHPPPPPPLPLLHHYISFFSSSLCAYRVRILGDGLRELQRELIRGLSDSGRQFLNVGHFDRPRRILRHRKHTRLKRGRKMSNRRRWEKRGEEKGGTLKTFPTTCSAMLTDGFSTTLRASYIKMIHMTYKNIE